MPKITFIGAGSTVFAKNLLVDILSFPDLSGSAIALHDIDMERLRTSEIVAKKIASALDVHPNIQIQVAGYKPGTVIDFEIPEKYGLRQTIADTLGIGGIMRGLRTVPVLLDICRDMEELCPNALLLNYVNPMSIICWALSRLTPIKMIGLCHSVQGTAEQIAKDINVPVNEINYTCAGINHMAFYLNFDHDGEDLYPKIRDVVKENRVPDWNRVRYEMLNRFGYFVT